MNCQCSCTPLFQVPSPISSRSTMLLEGDLIDARLRKSMKCDTKATIPADIKQAAQLIYLECKRFGIPQLDAEDQAELFIDMALYWSQHQEP